MIVLLLLLLLLLLLVVIIISHFQHRQASTTKMSHLSMQPQQTQV
jgi:hypothetical protein